MSWQQQCIELWGERWKSTLALTVGVSKRSVQYWNCGKHQIKPEVIEKINTTHKVWRGINDLQYNSNLQTTSKL